MTINSLKPPVNSTKMKPLEPQTDSKPLSKKKVLLIVALAVLTLSALGVSGYFLRSSLSGKSEESEDADVLAPMDENLPKFYFPEELVDPSLKAPQTADLKGSDWIGLMKYYNHYFHYNPSLIFESGHLKSIDSMTKLVIERVRIPWRNNETEIHVRLFYLEGLCRLGKEKMAMEIFDSVNNETINLMEPYGAPVLLLSKIKHLLKSEEIFEIIQDAISNPCISDEEIIAVLVSREDFRQWHNLLVDRTIGADRLDLFKHLIATISLYWNEESYSFQFEQIFLIVKNYTETILSPNQTSMINHFFEVAKNHKDFKKVSSDFKSCFTLNPHFVE